MFSDFWLCDGVVTASRCSDLIGTLLVQSGWNGRWIDVQNGRTVQKSKTLFYVLRLMAKRFGPWSSIDGKARHVPVLLNDLKFGILIQSFLPVTFHQRPRIPPPLAKIGQPNQPQKPTIGTPAGSNLPTSVPSSATQTFRASRRSRYKHLLVIVWEIGIRIRPCTWTDTYHFGGQSSPLVLESADRSAPPHRYLFDNQKFLKGYHRKEG
jgi:hypothetical protein